MRVLITGANGIVGSALKEHITADDLTFTYLDQEPHQHDVTVVADVSDLDAVKDSVRGHDAIVHLAVHPLSRDEWDKVLETNIIGTYNVVEAARQANIETIVFASSNHVVGMYEHDHAPAIYRGETDIMLTAAAPHRPDSLYGASKGWGEDICRYYTEWYDYPNRCQAIRIGSVHPPEYDHPYGPAEMGVERGDWERDSDEYNRRVARQKAIWQSRRDIAQQIELCLRDDANGFDIYHGVSNNSDSWFEIESAKRDLGYNPQDSGDDWTAPPEQ